MISILMAAMLAQQIAGRVINSMNGDGVADAVVILRAADAEHSLSYADTTDGKGRFSMADVAPGEYSVEVERAGFELERKGAAGAPRPSIKVSAGQRIDGLSFPLAPLGVITGRITDADGEPVRGARVEADRYVYLKGKKQLRAVAYGAAGDRGDFRLFGLREGTYYLKATGRQAGPYNLPDKGTGTYYPATSDARRAVPIELHAGAEMRGFDVRMQSSGAHAVRFRHADGDPASWWNEGQLFNSEGFVPTEQWSYRSEVGLGNIPPGSYDAIFIAGKEGEQPSYAIRHVEVAGEDVDGGELTFVPGVEIAGKVRVEGGPTALTSKLRVKLTSSYRDFPRLNASADVEPDGSFTMHGVAPLVYELSVDGISGVYLKSQARVDATEKLEPLVVVLGADCAELDGLVRNARGDAVARARVDAISSDRADFNRTGFSDDKGQYKIANLPPGQYKIFAWENVPDGAPQDPDFRKAFEKQATTLTTQPNGRANLRMTAISADQVDRSLR